MKFEKKEEKKKENHWNKIFSTEVEIIKRPLRDAYLCMGDLQAPPAPHFVFLITL